MDENYFEKIDLANIQNAEAAKVRKHERSIQRWKGLGTAAGFVALAAVICTGILSVWLAFKGPSTEDQMNEKVRLECIEADGTWLKLADGTDTYGTCVIGRPVEMVP